MRLIPAHAGSTLHHLGEARLSALSADNFASHADITPLTRGREPITQLVGLIPRSGMSPRYFKRAAMNQSVEILNSNYYLWVNGCAIY